MYLSQDSHGQVKACVCVVGGGVKVRELWIWSGKFKILAKVREESGKFKIASLIHNFFFLK